jgi:hypothetical protein
MVTHVLGEELGYYPDSTHRLKYDIEWLRPGSSS